MSAVEGRVLELRRFAVKSMLGECVMTTLAQQGLSVDREVLRTVAAHNRVDVSGLGPFACLGAYASVLTPGALAVGDTFSLA